MTDPLHLVVLLLVLCVIGWGAGFAAAMGWKGLLGSDALGLRVRIASVVIALLVGTSCSYAYVVVLASVGVVGGCDVARPVPVAC
jgi:hypothetical protein